MQAERALMIVNNNLIKLITKVIDGIPTRRAAMLFNTDIVLKFIRITDNNYLFVKQITLKDEKKVLSISSEIVFFKTFCNKLYLKIYKYNKMNLCNEISSCLTVGISVLVTHVSVFEILSKVIISQLTFKSQLYSLPIFLQVEVYSLL